MNKDGKLTIALLERKRDRQSVQGFPRYERSASGDQRGGGDTGARGQPVCQK